MVGVHTLEIIDVQCDLRMVDEALEELVQQVHVEVARSRSTEVHAVAQPRPAGEIDHDPG